MRQYIPQYVPEKRIEYVQVPKKQVRYEYIPVERQIVHYPDQPLEIERQAAQQTVYTGDIKTATYSSVPVASYTTGQTATYTTGQTAYGNGQTQYITTNSGPTYVAGTQ